MAKLKDKSGKGKFDEPDEKGGLSGIEDAPGWGGGGKADPLTDIKAAINAASGEAASLGAELDGVGGKTDQAVEGIRNALLNFGGVVVTRLEDMKKTVIAEMEA